MATFNSLPQGFAKFTGGSFGFYRGVAANSNRIADGNLLYAGDVNTYDGPWALPEHALKFNGMVKYSFDKDNWGGSVGIKAYQANWRPTNQIPLFAVEDRLIGRFGNIDATDNGKTGRYSCTPIGGKRKIIIDARRPFTWSNMISTWPPISAASSIRFPIILSFQGE